MKKFRFRLVVTLVLLIVTVYAIYQAHSFPNAGVSRFFGYDVGLATTILITAGVVTIIVGVLSMFAAYGNVLITKTFNNATEHMENVTVLSKNSRAVGNFLATRTVYSIFVSVSR